jgi:hypothetical protein
MLLLTAANGLDGAFLFFCALDHTLIRLKSSNVDTWLFGRRLESRWTKNQSIIHSEALLGLQQSTIPEAYIYTVAMLISLLSVRPTASSLAGQDAWNSALLYIHPLI